MTVSLSGHFGHPALFYRSDEDYLRTLVPFVTDGLAAGQPVAAAVPGDRLALLKSALGAQADQVHLLDMTSAGRNPGGIIAHVLRAFADQHPERHVRIIGEPIWRGRSGAEYPACVQHEALINAAFAGRDVTIVCPYDAERLDADVLADAEQTHPVVWDDGREVPSTSYAPDTAIGRYNLPLDPPGNAARCTAGSVADLAAVRRFTAAESLRCALSPERTADLEYIVTELATNSLVHAGSPAAVAVWPEAEHVVCQVSDTGRMTDPLAGRRPAHRGQLGGRGLLLVHAFADLLRTHTDARGTTVRVYLRRT
jgi:anti-sigma regulatory factor (Ser/Thr protein kinase)